MAATTLRQAHIDVVRTRVLEGVADLLAAGQDLTFAKVANAAGVPERTVYRHFRTKEVLLEEVWRWTNERVGFAGEFPVDEPGLTDMVRHTFRGFDHVAPLIEELLSTPEGRTVRLTANDERRRAVLELVAESAPQCDGERQRHVAAAIQVMFAASTWRVLREHWDMDGEEAGAVAAETITLLLQAARTLAPDAPRDRDADAAS